VFCNGRYEPFRFCSAERKKLKKPQFPEAGVRLHGQGGPGSRTLRAAGDKKISVSNFLVYFCVKVFSLFFLFIAPQNNQILVLMEFRSGNIYWVRKQ
jgi:hypothetical protein